jgi:hypothetical protein
VHHLRGLDEMALETAFIGLSSLVFIVVLATAVNTEVARRLDSVPLVGRVVEGVRALVGQVVHN